MRYRLHNSFPPGPLWSTSFPSLPSVRNAFLVASLLALIFVCGCGSRQASVEGDVTYDGQPVGVGRILFLPENPKLIKRGGRFENGHYKLAVPEGPPAGNHKVEIHWLKPTGKKYRNEFGEELDKLDEGL